MEHVDVESAVRDWLDAYSINPATGAPPDALLGVVAQRIAPFGQGALPADAPASPEAQWLVTATLFFPEEDEAELHTKAARIAERFQEALAADPLIGSGLELQWRGSDAPRVRHDAPADYPAALQVLLTARRGTAARA
jgi:hypothetical protein